jgi:hypothetical protein
MRPLDELRLTTGQAGAACILLETPTPDALDGCSTALEAAAGRLAALQSAGAELSAHPEALAEAWRLRRTVRRAAVLLAKAAAYHHDWQELVGIMSAGYGPGGRAAESPRPGRVCLEG